MRVFFIHKKLIIFVIILLIVLFSGFRLYSSFAMTALPKDKIISNSLKEEIMTLPYQDEKVAYLTFDDGPNPSVTPKILDILKEENIFATFFVIGKYVDTYPEIVKRAYEEGHFIANHTYHHDNAMLYKSRESFIQEIQKTDLAIGKAIDVKDYTSHLFRFPNGFIAPAYKHKKKEAINYLTELDYTYIDWNALNHDSMQKYNASGLLSNLKQSIKNKNTLVVLMHDTKDVSDSSTVLKESIQYLKSSGYTFENFYHFIEKQEK